MSELPSAMMREDQWGTAHYEAMKWSKLAGDLAGQTDDPVTAAAVAQAHALHALAIAVKDLADATRGEHI